MAALGPALEHHFSANRHHPEFHKDGVAGMNLLDVVEMLCDWKAASFRSSGGEFRKSVVTSLGRFRIERQLRSVILNTVESLPG